MAKSLYLPSRLDMIIERLPEGTGITLENLILRHTMYPYAKPTLTEERADIVYSILSGKEKECRSTYAKSGLRGRRLALPERLRYCPACVKSDTEQYGEAYWHRLHQLPGVFICPVHKEYICDSPFFVYMIYRNFYPATPELCNQISEKRFFNDETRASHIAFAKDSAWIMEHGMKLGTVDDMYEKHFQLMEVKGYRSLYAAHCDYRELNKAIHGFYVREFLESLSAYDENDYFSWPAYFARKCHTNPTTTQHLLMMRFLAESPEQFMNSSERFLPYGEPLWPCHNKVCAYYHKDCIEEIQIEIKSGQYKAVFTCSYCGFSYRRGKATPKELQYDGQVRMVDYGWLWKQKLKECLVDQELSVHQTVLAMGYSDTTIRKYAVLMNILPENRMPNTSRIYTRVESKDKLQETIESHRERWLKIINNHPDAKRSELGRLDLNNYKWLLQHDHKWFDTNSPMPSRQRIYWADKDEEYLTKAKQAVAEMRSQPGRPLWLCHSSIANKVGLGNSIYSMLDKLPLTKQYLNSIVEAKDDWRKRKLLWAIQQLWDAGQVLSFDSVFHLSGISKRVAVRFREYIEQEIWRQTNTE